MGYAHPDVIVREYKSKFIEPLLGDGEVSKRLAEGLYEVLNGKEILSNPVSGAFEKKRNSYVMAMNVFKKLGVKTIGDVAGLAENDILRIKGMGKSTLRYIKKELEKYGLSLTRAEDISSKPISEAFSKVPFYYTLLTNILEKTDIRIVGDLTGLTETYMLQQHGIGKETVKYIKKELGKYGLSLREVGTSIPSDPVGEADALDVDVLSKPVSKAFDTGYSYVRTMNIFEEIGVKTLGDVIQFTPERLSKIRHLGKTTLRYIKRQIGKYGLSLKDDNPH